MSFAADNRWRERSCSSSASLKRPSRANRRHVNSPRADRPCCRRYKLRAPVALRHDMLLRQGLAPPSTIEITSSRETLGIGVSLRHTPMSSRGAEPGRRFSVQEDCTGTGLQIRDDKRLIIESPPAPMAICTKTNTINKRSTIE